MQGETQTKLLKELIEEVKKLKLGGGGAVPLTRADRADSAIAVPAALPEPLEAPGGSGSSTQQNSQMKALMAAHQRQMAELQAKLSSLVENVEDHVQPALEAQTQQATNVRIVRT